MALEVVGVVGDSGTFVGRGVVPLALGDAVGTMTVGAVVGAVVARSWEADDGAAVVMLIGFSDSSSILNTGIESNGTRVSFSPSDSSSWASTRLLPYASKNCNVRDVFCSWPGSFPIGHKHTSRAC